MTRNNKGRIRAFLLAIAELVTILLFLLVVMFVTYGLFGV